MSAVSILEVEDILRGERIQRQKHRKTLGWHLPKHECLAPCLFLLNAILNGCAAICLVGGLISILNKRQSLHKKWMVSAFCFSTLFLISYIVYHSIQGDTPFLGTGIIRPIYFSILITHIALSFVALPLILITFYFALIGKFSNHKKIARWTWPIWMTVSVTGVFVYFFSKVSAIERFD